MENSGEKSFWKDIMLPAAGTGAVSTLFNLATMWAQNKFNSDQAQIARNWNQQMDNTKYQRQVVDMKAAGVNPALAMNGGVTTQATSNVAAQGATPAYMNLGAIAQMAQSISAARLNDAQAENIKADTEKKRADANKSEAETIGINIDNAFKEEFNQLEIEGKKLVNSRTEEEIKQIGENINKLKAETDLAIKQAKTEEEKVRLMITQEALNKANADQIVALTPFLQNYYAATTEDAKASAALKTVQAAYQQGLIDNGMIEATVKKMYADANEADAKAIYTMTMHMLGGEQAEIDKMTSETELNNVKKAVEIVKAVCEGVNTVVDGVGTFVPGGKVAKGIKAVGSKLSSKSGSNSGGLKIDLKLK